jgi:hypothetical protein
MAPPKRTKETEAGHLARFLANNYTDESAIVGRSRDSPFGDAAAHIYRNRDPASIESLHYLWRCDKYNVRQTYKDLMSSVNVDSAENIEDSEHETVNSIENNAENVSVSDDTEKNANSVANCTVNFAIQTVDERTANRMQVEVEGSSTYAIHHAPVILHHQPKKLTKSEKQGLACGACQIKFGPRPHALKCCACRLWYHKKKCCITYNPQSEREARLLTWKCNKCN